MTEIIANRLIQRFAAPSGGQQPVATVPDWGVTAAGRLSNAAAPLNKLHAVDSVASILAETTTSVTTTTRTAFNLKITNPISNMGVGFGGGMSFLIQDNAGVPNNIASIQARRLALDTEGRIVFLTGVGGAQIPLELRGLEVNIPAASKISFGAAAAANAPTMDFASNILTLKAENVSAGDIDIKTAHVSGEVILSNQSTAILKITGTHAEIQDNVQLRFLDPGNGGSSRGIMFSTNGVYQFENQSSNASSHMVFVLAGSSSDFEFIGPSAKDLVKITNTALVMQTAIELITAASTASSPSLSLTPGATPTSGQTNGDMWYDVSTNSFRGRKGGVDVTFDTTAV